MRIIKLLMVVALTLALSSCVYDKGSYLEQFEIFVSEVEEIEQMDDSDYAEIKEDYMEFAEEYYNKYKDELSADDEMKVLELKTRYYGALAMHGIKDLGEELEDAGKEGLQLINDLLK